MKGVRKSFAELIGFKVLTNEQAAQLLNYSKVSTMWEVLRGAHGMGPEKEQAMWDIWKTRREELEENKAKFRIKFAIKFPLTLDSVRTKKTRVLRERTPAGRDVRATMLVAEALLALLSDDLVEGLSPEEIAELRQSANLLQRLSTKLMILSLQLIPVQSPAGEKDQP